MWIEGYLKIASEIEEERRLDFRASVNERRESPAKALAANSSHIPTV
jgi:hypothetical protein